MLSAAMSRTVSGLMMAGAILLANSGAGAAPAEKSNHVAIVQAATAGLMVKTHPAGTWEPATGELRLNAGAALKTGSEGIAVLLRDGTRVDVAASSVVQFQVPTEINLEAGPTTRVARMDIKEGSMRVTIPSGGRPLLLMASKDVFAAFRSGTGRARVTPEGLIVAIDEGAAKVAASGRWTPLPAGKYQVLRTQGRQEGPKAVPPKVSFASDACRADASKACAIAVIVDEPGARVAARWNPVPGSSYSVELLRDRDGGPVVKRVSLQADQTSFTSDPLPSGSYVLSVQTVSAEGVEGARVLRPLRVVRMLPDPGVTWVPNAHALVLPRGRKVAVSGPAGLQIRAGESYVPAPASLELGQDFEHRNVVFRVEGDSTDETSVTLERSALRAEVKLTPMTAKWPQDKVEFRIRLQDPKGRIDVRTMQPRTRVRVNDTPIQLGLVREGEWWKASIPPRNGNGPWVIRVEALDADDNLLGYGALNVMGRTDRGRAGQW